jgi:DNA processing protein
MTTDEAPYAAALCRLPGAGPATLVRLLRDQTPGQVWADVRSGIEPALAADAEPQQAALWSEPGRRRADGRRREWQVTARRIDPEVWWEPFARQGIHVTWWGAPTYPAALLNDPEPPGVLFWRGSLEWLSRPCVALVGTRRSTPGGRRVAFAMGRDLAAAGVCVVSGLALGIDGAAHAGAVLGAAAPRGAGPVGVAANGVDVPYPRRHCTLWEAVASSGAVLSETLPGAPAEAWRFPVRNRIIAGLSQMVVVVESHSAGGSLITAEAALIRGVEVRVVPGPVQSPASSGSNQLLYDGPGPVRDAQDILDGLGLFRSDPAPGTGGAVATEADRGLTPDQRAVLEVVEWRPTSTGQIIERTGVPVARAMAALDGLEQLGRVTREGEWWVQGPPTAKRRSG